MNILILGVGSAQVDLLKFLSGKHTLHALSYTYAGEGRKYADYFELIDIKDRESVLDYAIKHRIELVYSVGSDLGMVTSAWVSHKLQLPTFVSPDTAILCHTKNLMRAKLGGLEGNIDYKLLSTPKDIGNFQFPCIIKPIDSQGQRGVFLVHDKDELEKKFSSSIKYSTAKMVIAEKYIDGPEISVNTHVINGEIVFALISDRIVLPDYPIGFVHKHRIPSRFIDYESELSIHNLISEVITKIGIKNGPVYFQIILNNSKPKLIEVSPRLDGCHLWKLIKYATGTDLLKTAFDHLMGINCGHILSNQIEESWVLQFLCEKPGKIVDTNRYDLDNSYDHVWYYNNGDVVKPINHVIEKCGYYIYKEANLADVSSSKQSFKFSQ